MGIADLIEQFLLSYFGDEDKVVISRNNLAEHFSCAPSQINYVLTTRFSPDRGYAVESKRGGGGYITVIRIGSDDGYLTELQNELKGVALSMPRAKNILSKLVRDDFISERESRIILAALSDKNFIVKTGEEDNMRSAVFKNILLELLKERRED